MVSERMCAEAERLGMIVIHELEAEDALEESREVLDIGGGGELATGDDVIGIHTLNIMDSAQAA